MDSTSSSELLNKYTKCGHIYKSPDISDNNYLLLSCLHCSDIFWQLETFLAHSEKHLSEDVDVLFSQTYEEEHPDLQNTAVKFETETRHKNEAKISQETLTKSNNNEKIKDPLEEDGYDLIQLDSDTVKIENSSEILEKVEIEVETELSKEQCSLNDGEEDPMLEDTDSEDDDSDDDFKPDKESDEDEIYVDHDGDDDDVDANDLVTDDNNDQVCNFQTRANNNLKRFTKNHDFIRTIIEAYKQQDLLWDTTHKSRNPPKKLEAYNTILKIVNGKYSISATTRQIEMIIKRLRLRFIHQYRKNNSCSDNSDDNYSPLWFYDILKFIEPHISGIKQKTSVCQQLTDEQFLALIKLIKENECFWNENNIYHTSVIYRQESLQTMTNNFNTLYNLEEITVNEMKHIVEELKEIAMEENKRMLEESKTVAEYESLHRFYNELQFLLPHVGPFNCKHCEKKCSDVYAYKFHVSKHEGTKPFKCMLCQKELTHKKEFMCHLRRHTKECPFQCELCDKSFPSKKEWQRHVIKHGSKPYVCELCADSFYTQHQLTNHMKNHANIRDHVCPQCGKGFTHRGLLRQHLQTHNKTECLCPVCNNVYANPRSLRKHYVRVHELQEESSSHIYNCKICMITFPTMQEAKQHRKEHKQSLPAKRKHICDICGHDFAYPRNLADHKKTHSNIRDQVCDVCGKAFTNSNLLNQHKNVHNGQKFVCKACGKDYAHYRGLCRHITKVHGSNIKELCSVIEKQKHEMPPDQL